MKPENQFIKSVNKHIPVDQVYRMKNHNAYVAGVPDCWYSGSAQDLWVEYKYISAKSPRIQVVPNLSQQQFNWIQQRTHEGRNIWTIVGCPSGGVVYDTLEQMEFGLPPDEFLARIEPRKDLALKILDHCTRS